MKLENCNRKRNATISVVIPVYNVGMSLYRCLDCILTQSFRDFECILINGGSKDKSGAICDEYAARDSRIRGFSMRPRLHILTKRN